MPWLIIFFAVLYFVAAWQGAQSVKQLNSALATDLPNFATFGLMVLVIWAIGLWTPARKPAYALMVLAIVAIALSSSGGLSNFMSQIQNITVPQGPVNTAPSQMGDPAQSGGSSAGSSIGNSIASGIGGGLIKGLGSLFAL